jgi:hypothetical protein
VLGPLITAAVEGAIDSVDLEYSIFRLILDRMLDYSMAYHLYSVQFIAKLMAGYNRFRSLVTLEDWKRMFLFDYDCSEVEPNDRGTLRTIVNKQFTIFERIVSVELIPDQFYTSLVFAFQIFYHATLLRLDFLCTSVATSLKRLCEGRSHINDLDTTLKNLSLRSSFSQALQHTSAYRLLISLFKHSFQEINKSVSIFEPSYYRHFMANYIEWDNPFEYYIILDQNWLQNDCFEFKEEFVADLVQKIKSDVNHRMRKHGKLFRLFCKFYNRYFKDDENDLRLKLIMSKGCLTFTEVNEIKALKWGYLHSVFTLDPVIICCIEEYQRKHMGKYLKRYNFKKTVATELEQENPELAEAFGTKMHYYNLLAKGAYTSIKTKLASEGKANNRYFAISVCKLGKFGLSTLYARHTGTTDSSSLLQTATGKTILSRMQKCNAYQYDLARSGKRLLAYSKVVDPEGSISIYDMTLRKALAYDIEHQGMVDAIVVAILDNYIVITNNDDNALEIYSYDAEDANCYKSKHSKHAYISLWRYGRYLINLGKLRLWQTVTFRGKPLLMLCFEDSRSVYFLDIAKRVLNKLKLDITQFSEVSALYFDSKACRLLAASEESLALFNLKTIFAS